MIILPGTALQAAGLLATPKRTEAALKGAPAGGFGTLANRLISAQLLMDMARITPFQAMEEERRKYRKFQKMNRQSLRLHQALLPLVSEDDTVNVLAMREVHSQDGAVIGGDASPGAPLRRYVVLVNQLALPMKVHSTALPPKDMPPTPVGMHGFKLLLENQIFPLNVEVFGQDTNQMVMQKIIQSMRPFVKKVEAHTFRKEGLLTLEMASTATGKDAAFALEDPSGFLGKLGLSTERPKRGLDGGVVHRAQDAMIELDREVYVSPTNFFDLKEKNGLKLKVQGLSLKGPLTLEVRRPEKPVLKQVNKLTQELDQHLLFLGHEENHLLASVYQRYSSFLEGLSSGGGGMAGMVMRDGRLALDEAALKRALTESPAEVEALLRNPMGGGKQLFQEINQVLATPMALSENQAVFRPPLRDQPLVLFLTTSSPFLRTAMIAQTEGFFLNLFA